APAQRPCTPGCAQPCPARSASSPGPVSSLLYIFPGPLCVFLPRLTLFCVPSPCWCLNAFLVKLSVKSKLDITNLGLSGFGRSRSWTPATAGRIPPRVRNPRVAGPRPVHVRAVFASILAPWGWCAIGVLGVPARFAPWGIIA
ncbi:Unknown protein, partial [Striga hermonthica]